MARKRDYKAEYRRRIRRGLARGLSLSQARGHATASEQPIEAAPVDADPKIDAAILKMNRGTSMTAAARSRQVSVERLRRFIVQKNLAERQGRRWVISDSRPRRMPVITGGTIKTPTIAGFSQATKVGKHHNAVKAFLTSNDLTVLEPFEGDSVFSASGVEFPLETDPNALHRIASMDMPAFHEIYEIVSPT